MWITSTKSIFRYIRCPDNQKVQCVVFLHSEKAIERMLGVNRFVKDLKKDLQGFVRAFKPTTQAEALCLTVDMSAHEDDDLPKTSGKGPSIRQKRKA
ncbi:gag-protease polyprotein [Cucumis melo var. makuwa]|uniref:Gag-protease polyprotein n=1 Tax=Cucumis melo var. makuwa TaxID=1194695 RepID=A0A5D3CT58_CUCMM|nr:gag-protease polyprotein [Cucumis melo var. makuwa]